MKTLKESITNKYNVKKKIITVFFMPINIGRRSWYTLREGVKNYFRIEQKLLEKEKRKE